MASRKLIVEIVGDSRSFERSLGRSSRAARGFSKQLSGTLGVQRGFTRSIAGASAAFLGGAGLAAAIGSTIGKAASFERSLNIFQAVSKATATQMRDVSAAATELGADITLPATSAKDAAEAMTTLAKGGLDVEDSMNAARGSLQLAAAANISAAEAAEIMASQLNAFGLEGSEATRVADVLAATANAATGEITDFALGFQQASAVAHQFGLSVEETAAALAVLAKSGIRGSDAGTSVRTMLQRLVPQTEKSEKTMRRLGIVWRDAHGNLTPFRDLLEQYHEALTELPGAQRQMALQTIFGSDAQRAANIIFGQAPRVFDGMVRAVSAQGAAAKLAAAQNKGYTGAIDALKSAVETVQILIGTALLPALTDAARGAATWLSEAGNQQRVVDGFTGAANAALAVAGAVGGIIEMLGGVQSAIAIVIGAWVGFRVAGVTTAAAIAFANIAAATTVKTAWRAALVATGWGIVAIAAGAAAGYIITHWTQVKIWFQQFWIWLRRTAYETVLAILEPFSHLPRQMGQWARDAKGAVELELQTLATEAATLGRAAGDNFGANFAGAVNEHLALVQHTIATTRKAAADAKAAGPKITVPNIRVPQITRTPGGVPDVGGGGAAKTATTAKPKGPTAAERRASAQFRALGLGPTGEALVPGVPALKRVFARINTALKGTILDTRKTKSLMATIRKILSGGMGQVGEEVRRKIQGILGDFDRKLKEDAPKLGYQWRKVSVEAFIRSLGLDLTPEQLRRLRAGLAGFGGGALTVPPGSSLAYATAGVTVNGNVNLYGVQNMREFEGELAKRDRSRPDVRRGAR